MQKLYSRLLPIIILFVIGFYPSSKVHASHAMGGDVTYRCISSNPIQYEVTVSFYRDCHGISAPPTMSLDITSSCSFAQTVTLNPLPTSPTEISPNCPTALSTCNPGGTFTGIQEWVYQGIVTLSGPCADWTFSHTEGVRNQAISTIVGNGSDNLYIYSIVNNLGGVCDNSPIFTNNPVPFACDSQRFCFNHGASDPDGDSLAYEIITPRTGPSASDTVQYKPGYTATQPVKSNPPMTFNPITGDFCMRPYQLDVTVLAVLVKSYRNGVLIGQVERDIQVTVLDCQNKLPLLLGVDNKPFFFDTVCAGNQLCFTFASIDPDPLNNTTITWDHSIPGATVTTHPGAHRDTAVFCWTPTPADISPSHHCFTATVSDDNCPILGVQVYAYCILVRGVDPDAGPDQTVPCGALANLSGSATGGDGTFVYTWNPGGVGQTLNGVGPGTYYLTVSSAGCTNVDTVDISPGLGQPAAFFGYVGNCSGAPVVFLDSSSVVGSSLSSWSWDFGDFTPIDNAQNPSHQFATNGTYTVTLTVSTPTNCTATYSMQVVVNTHIPVAQFLAPPVCEGGTVNFTDQSLNGPMNAWTWDFDDAGSTSNLQNPTHLYTNPGTYNVTLSVTNTDGCQHQAQQSVTVNANPIINVTPGGVCAGGQDTLFAPPGYVNYSWDIGQFTQDIIVSPLLTTSYTVTVTDANGCTGSATSYVSVDPVPIADAGLAQTICEGTTANLSAGGGSIYTWNPGNISGQNITVSPTANTLYTVTVGSNAGCSSTDTVTVVVNPMPTANAGSDQQICDGQSSTINAITSSGNIVWTPGNFTTSSITVTPSVTTIYYLTISDAIGCSGGDTVTVVVNPIPVANFNSSGSICEDNQVTFSDLSNVASGSINSWDWIFGNGTTSNAQNPVVQYSDPGAYDVKLVITADGGCSDTIDVNLNIWARPTASYTHTEECLGTPINFSNASSIVDGSTLNFNWNLGDNSSANTPDVVHLYGAAGSYVSSLVVTSLNGCIDSINSLVNIFAIPVANFNADYGCEGQATIMEDQSAISSGSIASWNWSFGDNATSTQTNPSHTYATSGTYNIHLLVSSDHNCPNSIDKLLRVVPPPTVDFATENACLGYSVDFTNMSQPVTGPIVLYKWEFGDGNTSTVENPQHSYVSSGSFQVTLTATSDSGCTTTLVKPRALDIFALPNVNFNSNASESSDIFPQVSFFNMTGTNGVYLWSFGDGDTSTEYSPTHMYPTTGFYDVWLLAVDVNGCVDSNLLRIEIKPTSNVYVPNTFTPNGDQKNDFFRVYSYNVKDIEVQIYDRWGIKIIEWDNPVGAWDGRIGGSPAQADVYVYRVSTIDLNNKQEVRIGHVSLVR